MTSLPAAVLQKSPSPKMSDRYVHIDSSEVIALMAAEGFQVAKIETPVSRRKTQADPLFIKHQIDFRREDWIANPRNDKRGGYVPRVLYTNSHDGTTAASFMMGVYAFVCSNGMVVGSTYASEKVRHAGETAKGLIGRMQKLAGNTAPLFDQIDKWQEKQLTGPQAREFARLASVLRWGDPHRFDAQVLLSARRDEDDAGDLWSVFNRVQENTVRGGLNGLSRSGRAATSRPLSELASTTKYNADLWRLAEDFAAL